MSLPEIPLPFINDFNDETSDHEKGLKIPASTTPKKMLESHCESHMNLNLVMELDRNNDKMEVTMVVETGKVMINGGGPTGETIYNWE